MNMSFIKLEHLLTIEEVDRWILFPNIGCYGAPNIVETLFEPFFDDDCVKTAWQHDLLMLRGIRIIHATL